MTAALHVFAQEVYAALRLDFGDGITHSTLDDKLVYTFVMSVSDRPETLPYPSARLRKFQEIIDLQKPPTVLAFRPRTVSIPSFIVEPRQLTSILQHRVRK